MLPVKLKLIFSLNINILTRLWSALFYTHDNILLSRYLYSRQRTTLCIIFVKQPTMTWWFFPQDVSKHTFESSDTAKHKFWKANAKRTAVRGNLQELVHVYDFIVTFYYWNTSQHYTLSESICAKVLIIVTQRENQ